MCFDVTEGSFTHAIEKAALWLDSRREPHNEMNSTECSLNVKPATFPFQAQPHWTTPSFSHQLVFICLGMHGGCKSWKWSWGNRRISSLREELLEQKSREWMLYLKKIMLGEKISFLWGEGDGRNGVTISYIILKNSQADFKKIFSKYVWAFINMHEKVKRELQY